MNNVFVIDDFLNESQYNYWIDVLENSWFKRNSTSLPNSKYYIWRSPLDENFLNDNFLIKQCIEEIKNKFNKNYVLISGHINAQESNNITEFHPDSLDNHITGILFLIKEKEWDDNWGGETVFKTDNEYKYVMPKRKRLILFDSRVKHMGRSTQQQYLNARYTLALNFKLSDKNE